MNSYCCCSSGTISGRNSGDWVRPRHPSTLTSTRAATQLRHRRFQPVPAGHPFPHKLSEQQPRQHSSPRERSSTRAADETSAEVIGQAARRSSAGTARPMGRSAAPMLRSPAGTAPRLGEGAARTVFVAAFLLAPRSLIIGRFHGPGRRLVLAGGVPANTET